MREKLLTNISQLDVKIYNETIATITVEIDEIFLEEVGEADEFNKELCALVSNLIQNFKHQKNYQ